MCIHTVLNGVLINKLFEKEYDFRNTSWDWFQKYFTSLPNLAKIDDQLASDCFSDSTLVAYCGPRNRWGVPGPVQDIYLTDGASAGVKTVLEVG